MRIPTPRLVAAARTWWAGSLGGRGLSRVRELDLDTHALAFSAQQVLCTAPLLVAISSILDRFTGRDLSRPVARFFALHHESSVAVGRLFSHASRRMSMSELVFGLVVAVLFTTGVATVQQRAFELIWTLPRVISVRGYLRQLVWVPALAVFVAALLATARVARGLADGPVVSAVVVPVLQAVVVFGFYWWTQRWLLGGRVEWRALLPGAAAVAVGTVVAVAISRQLVDGQISWQVEAYGLVGAVFVLAVWLGIFSAVIFGGVLVGALWVENRRVDAAAAAVSVEDQLAAVPLTVEGLESEAAALELPGEPAAEQAGAAREPLHPA